MKELTLQELKDIELDILKKFDTFCRNNNIKYFLAFGTLLGAIRYKKFIPWDDDIDVLVPREDYNKMISIFQDCEQYRLYSLERNPNFHYPFAKLCDMSTKKEQTVYKNSGVDLGVEIDIFPLDSFDNEITKAKYEIKRIKKFQKKLKITKLEKPISTNKIKRCFWSVALRFYKTIGGRHYVRKIIKESYKPNQKESAYVGAKVWSIYGERGIIPAEVFLDTIEVEFEGQMFPAPAGYDTYLTCLYGDYLPEPPKEKQKSHHDFIAYRL